MKLTYFLIGLLIGGTIVFFLRNKFIVPTATNFDNTTSDNINHWTWPDSLDALIAAPENHKLVYENEELRILNVTVVPGILDPIHTHRGKSIVWVTKASPLLYHVYDFDANKKLKLIKTDTITFKINELNKANWEKPQPPHSVENIGTDTFQLYRIEYKN